MGALLAQPTVAPGTAGHEHHVHGSWALATDVAQTLVLVVLVLKIHVLSPSDLSSRSQSG
jgi:hypothetical protein